MKPEKINYGGSVKELQSGEESKAVSSPGHDDGREDLRDTEKQATSTENPLQPSQGNDNLQETAVIDDAPYSVLGHREKLVIMISAGFMAVVSPLSSAIYYPALNDIANELGVTPSLVNLTITTYMIFQGITPSFVGSFSDSYGRRPAYLYCFTMYLAANIGLALQNNYAALIVLRCLQAAGSSGTIAVGSAVVADLSTRAERGTYLAYATLGTTLGPALGPVLGGVLDQYLGWRSIFWFLTILSGVLLLFCIVFMPETCRAVVGNGSVPPPRWNRPLVMILRQRKLKKEGMFDDNAQPEAPRKKRPNPFTSVRIIGEKEAGVLLLYSGLCNAGFFLTLSTLTSELGARYGYDSLIIGLCYLPVGFGSISSRYFAGTLIDRNFRRIAAMVGMEITKNKQQDIEEFPIEKARLQVQIPLLYLGCASLITYGWVMDFHTSIAGPLVVLFFLGLSLSGCNTCLNTLIVDTHKDSPATASAASNLTRCLFGAGATAFATPLINRIGIGWTGTFVALVWMVFSPALWAVYFWGMGWRKAMSKKESERSS